jgi:hypothetical protein
MAGIILLGFMGRVKLARFCLVTFLTVTVSPYPKPSRVKAFP